MVSYSVKETRNFTAEEVLILVVVDDGLVPYNIITIIQMIKS